MVRVKILVLVTVRVAVSCHVSKCPKKPFSLSTRLKHRSHVEPRLLMLESEAFPHRCHVTSLTAGGSGRLTTASSPHPQFPLHWLWRTANQLTDISIPVSCLVLFSPAAHQISEPTCAFKWCPLELS